MELVPVIKLHNLLKARQSSESFVFLSFYDTCLVRHILIAMVLQTEFS